tara:strand:- start:7911 stop:8312 length:402 start_codon:yes stop_codon:yes gene_type:complete
MANRLYKQFGASPDSGLVFFHGFITIGATGAVSAFKGLGISSVVKTAIGVYTVTMEDAFPAFLGANGIVVFNGLPVVAAVAMKQDPAINPGPLKSVVLHTLDFAGGAISPDVGSRIYFEIKMRNSSVLPSAGV